MMIVCDACAAHGKKAMGITYLLRFQLNGEETLDRKIDLCGNHLTQLKDALDLAITFFVNYSGRDLSDEQCRSLASRIVSAPGWV